MFTAQLTVAWRQLAAGMLDDHGGLGQLVCVMVLPTVHTGFVVWPVAGARRATAKTNTTARWNALFAMKFLLPICETFGSGQKFTTNVHGV